MFSRLKNAGKSLLSLGYEAIQPEIEPFVKPVRETREKLGKILDRQRVLIGYRIDKTMSQVLKGIAEVIRPSHPTVEEWKKRWADKHAPFTEDGKPPETEGRFFVLDKIRKGMDALYHWADEMDRTPPTLGSDSDLMSFEEESYHRYHTDIEHEESTDPVAQEESDRLVEKQLLHHLNKRRGLPLTTFPANHRMSQLALQRASYYLKNPTGSTAPLHQVYYPAQQRGLEKKARTDLSAAEYLETHQSEEAADGSLVYHVPQRADAFAQQARDRQSKAYSMKYEEFSTVFDLENDSYPSNAQFQQALDKACERDSFRQLLSRDDARIAFGFCRKGSKACLTCFVVIDPTLHVEDRPLEKEAGIENSDDWWIRQIPAVERGDGSLWNGLAEKVGGYSAYSLYQFFKGIKQLRDEHDPALQIDHPKELKDFHLKPIRDLFGANRQTLRFPITVNGNQEQLHLIQGTDKILTSPGSIIALAETQLDEDDKKKKKKVKGETLTAREYLERVKDRLQPQEAPLAPQPQQP